MKIASALLFRSSSSNVDNEEEVDDYLDDDDEKDVVVYVDIGEILDSHYNEARLSLEIEERNVATEPLPRSERERTLNATLNNEDSDSDNDICNLVAHIHLPRHLRCTCHSLNLIGIRTIRPIILAESCNYFYMIRPLAEFYIFLCCIRPKAESNNEIKSHSAKNFCILFIRPRYFFCMIRPKQKNV